MNNKKIIFLGTPEFAASVLEGLITNGYNVVAVISQPDKEVGRKRILTPTPVKEIALKYNIPVYQPIKLRNDFDFIYQYEPDMLITAAYGQILPHAVLEIAKVNNINVHASLLPKLRGGAPIHRSIINGDAKTGVTIMEMVDKMDAGRMYAKKEFVINDEINTSELFIELAKVGTDLLLSCLDDLLENKIEGEVQNEEEVTYAPNIKREEEKIDFSKSTKEISLLIRGLANVPGAYATYNNKIFKIYKASIYKLAEDNVEVGTLSVENKKDLLLKCKDGYLKLIEIQMEGKGKMLVKDFLNGVNLKDFLSRKIS